MKLGTTMMYKKADLPDCFDHHCLRVHLAHARTLFGSFWTLNSGVFVGLLACCKWQQLIMSSNNELTIGIVNGLNTKSKTKEIHSLDLPFTMKADMTSSN